MGEPGRQRPPESTWKVMLWCQCGMVCIWRLTFCIRSRTAIRWKFPARYSCQGGFSKYVDEGNDGYDTIEWLARQPWCNGKIGVYGLSYAAHTQAALACLNPPHLVCMWLDCGGFSNAFISGCRNGG